MMTTKEKIMVSTPFILLVLGWSYLLFPYMMPNFGLLIAAILLALLSMTVVYVILIWLVVMLTS